MMNFSDGEDAVVSIQHEEHRLGDGLFWTTVCAGPGHEMCVPVVVADYGAVLDRETGLGAKLVLTPLQGLFCNFLLKRMGATTTCRRLVETIVAGQPGAEFVMFLGGKGDSIPADAIPTAADLAEALEMRVRACRLAWQELASSGYRVLRLPGPTLPFDDACQTERMAWEQFFGTASWALEELRARLVHRCILLEEPRILVGDSTAAQLATEMTAVHVIAPPASEGMGAIVRGFDKVVLSSRVRAVLVVFGRDALVANDTLETIEEHIRRIQSICSRYDHLDICWPIPPFVLTRQTAYLELVQRMAVLVPSGNIRLGYIEGGRSLLEVYMYGNTMAGTRINRTGQLTEHGIKIVLAWLYQVAKFPGERALGRPRIRSQVVRPAPVQNRLGDGCEYGRYRERASGSAGHSGHRREDREPPRDMLIARSLDRHPSHRSGPYRQEPCRDRASWRRSSPSSSRRSSHRRQH